MSRDAELAIVERIVTSATRFRAATVAGVVRLKGAAEVEYRRCASTLDFDLRMLAKVRGHAEPWPPPPRPVVGSLVALERDGQRFAGYIASVDGDGLAEVVGVVLAPGAAFAVFCRWHAHVSDVRVVD